MLGYSLNYISKPILKDQFHADLNWLFWFLGGQSHLYKVNFSHDIRHHHQVSLMEEVWYENMSVQVYRY